MRHTFDARLKPGVGCPPSAAQVERYASAASSTGLAHGLGWPLPGRQQSTRQTSWLGPLRPSARFGSSGESRSWTSSRIIETKLGCVPTVDARTRLSPSSEATSASLDVEVEEDLHVVGDEPDRRDDDVVDAADGEIA